MWNLAKRVFWRFFCEVRFFHLIHLWPYKMSRRRRGKGCARRGPVMEILVVQLADIGDLVMTSVFLRELRVRYPKARITLVTAPHTATLARSCPDVDAVEVFDYRGLAGEDWKKMHTGCGVWWKAAEQLWDGGKRVCFDLAVSVRQDPDPVQAASQIVLAASGARWTVGYELRWLLGRLRSTRLLDVAVPRRKEGHEVQRQLHLLAEMGGVAEGGSLVHWMTPEAEAEAEAWFRRLEFQDGGRCFGMHLGTGHLLKRWPRKFFVEVARWLEEEMNCRVLLFGGAVDAAETEEVVRGAGLRPEANMAGKVELNVTAAMLRRLDGFIGNDSGPLHLAAAAGIPVIGLYGPTDPGRYGPWKARHRIVTLSPSCGPCSLRCRFETNRCLQDLSPGLVQKAVREILAEAEEKGRFLPRTLVPR
jgi:ADP-heptose:LPS heptosyltransferase